MAAVRKRLIGLLHLVVPLSMLALALGLRVGAPSFERYQLDVFDVFQRLEPRAYVESPVRVVDLDDASLERIGQWPWPRTDVAQLLVNLANAGVAAVALDIVFAEPDRTSPARVLPKWPSTPETEALLNNIDSLPDHDAVLADIIGQMSAAGIPVVTGFSLITDETAARPAEKGSFAYSGDDPRRYLPLYRGAVVTLPELEAAASGNGSFSIAAEADSNHPPGAAAFPSWRYHPSLARRRSAARGAGGEDLYRQVLGRQRRNRLRRAHRHQPRQDRTHRGADRRPGAHVDTLHRGRARAPHSGVGAVRRGLRPGVRNLTKVATD